MNLYLTGLLEKHPLAFLLGSIVTAGVSGFGFCYSIYVEPVELIKDSHTVRISQLQKALLDCAQNEDVYVVSLTKEAPWRAPTEQFMIKLLNVEDGGPNSRAQLSWDLDGTLPTYLFTGDRAEGITANLRVQLTILDVHYSPPGVRARVEVHEMQRPD